MKNPEVDWFFEKDSKWQNEYKILRRIMLDCVLREELKWGVPCYFFKDDKIVLIHGFKAYCALLFIKGVLLKDTDGILIQQTKNVQAARQIRFANLKEIVDLEASIKRYIFEAIEIEKAGLEVKMKKASEFEMPDALKRALKDNSKLNTAFYTLTAGRQRGYLLYFSQAKQNKTREARIKKYIPMILEGKGLND